MKQFILGFFFRVMRVLAALLFLALGSVSLKISANGDPPI